MSINDFEPPKCWLSGCGAEAQLEVPRSNLRLYFFPCPLMD